jgi:KEOPS complex subunit Cgi121
LLKYLAKEGKYIGITGFRNVEVNKLDELLKSHCGEEKRDVSVQFFNANLVATWEHLYFAVLDALMAFRTKRNISKSLAVEFMLYASAQRQIRKAIEIIGVKTGRSNIAIVVAGENRDAVESIMSSISAILHKEQDDQVLEFSPAKVRIIRGSFGITETELNVVAERNEKERSLANLVIERMALLSTKR